MNWSRAQEFAKEHWLGVSFLLAVLIGLTYAGWQISLWLEDEQQAPVNEIVVKGQRHYLDDSNIVSLIRERHAGSFFALQVNQLHQDLERLPWIYRASVRKRWPNNLTIYVVEQKPVARWNSDMLLNQYGESFDARVSDKPLPELYGPGGSEQTALQGYLAMQTLLNTARLQIEELTLSERFAWHVKLNNGVRLNLGRSEFVNRLQRFVDLYPLLEKEERTVDYVDLRYDTGLAVGWKAETNSEQES